MRVVGSSAIWRASESNETCWLICGLVLSGWTHCRIWSRIHDHSKNGGKYTLDASWLTCWLIHQIWHITEFRLCKKNLSAIKRKILTNISIRPLFWLRSRSRLEWDLRFGFGTPVLRSSRVSCISHSDQEYLFKLDWWASSTLCSYSPRSAPPWLVHLCLCALLIWSPPRPLFRDHFLPPSCGCPSSSSLLLYSL